MFNDAKVKALKPKDAAYYEWEPSPKGAGRFGVKVEPTGTKTFYFRYYDEAGNRKFVNLGKFPNVTLSQARDAAKALSAQVSTGVDPKKTAAAAAEADAKLGSIKDLFHLYTERMRADGKRTYASVLSALEKEVYPFIDPDTKAKDIKPSDIKNVLTSMLQRGAGVQTNRVRSYLLAAFNYGIRSEHDPSVAASTTISFALESNPVAVIPRQKGLEKVGENWLKIDEVRYVIKTFGKAYKVGFQSDRLLRLCFYTGGQRPYELATSKWASIDLEERTWTIEKEVSKTSRPHIIPLCNSSVAIIRELKARNFSESEYVFANHDDKSIPYNTDSLSQAVRYYRKAEPDMKRFIPRDIRRTTKTLMGMLGVSKETRDILQNHARNDVSSRHYDRYGYLREKREAIELFEKYLNGLPVDDSYAVDSDDEDEEGDDD